MCAARLARDQLVRGYLRDQYLRLAHGHDDSLLIARRHALMDDAALACILPAVALVEYLDFDLERIVQLDRGVKLLLDVVLLVKVCDS
jgi:hypothetical protein